MRNEREPLPIVLVRKGDHLGQRISVPALRKVPNGREISEVPEAASDSLSCICREKGGQRVTPRKVAVERAHLSATPMQAEREPH